MRLLNTLLRLLITSKPNIHRRQRTIQNSSLVRILLPRNRTHFLLLLNPRFNNLRRSSRRTVRNISLIFNRMILNRRGIQLTRLITLPYGGTRVLVNKVNANNSRFNDNLPHRHRGRRILRDNRGSLNNLINLIMITKRHGRITRLLMRTLLKNSGIPSTHRRLIRMVQATVQILRTLIVRSRTLRRMLLRGHIPPATRLRSAKQARTMTRNRSNIRIMGTSKTLRLTTALSSGYRKFLSDYHQIRLPILGSILRIRKSILLYNIGRLHRFRLHRPSNLLLNPRLSLTTSIFNNMRSRIIRNLGIISQASSTSGTPHD